MSSGGSSVRVDRVVAVAAALRDGREQLGSGYLVSGRLVLTAEHCTRDKATGVAAARLRVVRASDGAEAEVAGVVSDRGLDVAVLQLADDAPWDADLPRPAFARVDQSQGGVLDDCAGIGFALFQRDPARRTRHTSEFHGRIYQTDERESGQLLMREPLIHPGPVTKLEGVALSERGEEGPSPWGGLSGALMFYRGSAIGVVVEHHPRQGDSALLAVGFERIAAASAEIRQCLALPAPGSLPCVSEQAAARVVLAGRPLDEVTDPFTLEVHRPVQAEDAPPGLPALPAYLPREHDVELGSVVRAAPEGRSGIAVLVGGSSTGKTRACWEALQLLRDRPGQWRLWHPIDPSRPDAALRELPVIGPRTVVWLNEAQFYLDVADGGLGERVAAGLRELLRDPARAPVLVLATLWPQFWDGLTVRPAGGTDPHAQARELLAGHDIMVPAAFTAPQMERLTEAGDARLALAARSAPDGQVIQFLAGAPELLARYHKAPPAAAALIHAAMDARRLGMGGGLPQSFLEAAAPGYLTDAEWDTLGEDWLEQALSYTAKPCKGVPGPLTRIRSRPARSRATEHGSRDSDEQLAGNRASIPAGPLYRLADYLDQHGRQHRKSQFPPVDFWAAAADHAFPGDQAMMGYAAHDRGLYQDAAQLCKNAAAHGNSPAAVYLANPPHCLRADIRPMRWAVAHVSLEDPGGVARLLFDLREAGAHEQAAALLARDPAARVSLDDPGRVVGLLHEFWEAGAHEQAAALLGRDLAARVSLDDPRDVARLLDSLREAGAHEQAAALLARDPAARVSLRDPLAVADLLDRLREAGADEQAAALASRAAAHVVLDDPGDVIILLDSLRKAGAHEQAAALLGRDLAARVSLRNPRAVARLLAVLREAGAHEQAAALAERAAARVSLEDPLAMAWLLRDLWEAGAHEQAAALAGLDPAARVSLDSPRDVARLLDSLRVAGAHEQAAALAERAAARVSLEDPLAVAWLLRVFRLAGAHEQAAALLGRDPAARVSLEDPYGSLEDPYGVASLLDSLREAGADEQAAALAGRLPGAGMFELFLEQQDGRDRFRFGREADGSPARPWGWEDLD